MLLDYVQTLIQPSPPLGGYGDSNNGIAPSLCSNFTLNITLALAPLYSVNLVCLVLIVLTLWEGGCRPLASFLAHWCERVDTHIVSLTRDSMIHLKRLLFFCKQHLFPTDIHFTMLIAVTYRSEYNIEQYLRQNGCSQLNYGVIYR